jgi:hypothetical protein
VEEVIEGGRLATRHWTDRETGERRCRTEIHAINVIFLGGVQQANLMPGYCEHIPDELFEGDEFGIAAPIARERPRWWHFVRLAALAGLPAVLGVWIGGFVYNALLAALFLALGQARLRRLSMRLGSLCCARAVRRAHRSSHLPPLAG